jgi:molybdopterin synthase catalytic subunit
MKVIAIVGYHKTGKTTLVERLVKELTKYGRVGTVKHTREEILPTAGDTERHLNAGAEVTIGVTETRLIKIIKNTDLKVVLDQLLDEGLDFAVVEGFKESGVPKIGIGEVVARNIIARVDIEATGEVLAKIAMEQPDYVTMEYLVARIMRNPRIKEAGAIGTFAGIVCEAGESARAGAMYLGDLNRVAEERIKNVEEEIKKLEGILDAYVYRAGYVEAGGDLAYIVVLSRRREDMFPALTTAIERLKEEMPIEKQGLTGTGDFWVRDLR